MYFSDQKTRQTRSLTRKQRPLSETLEPPIASGATAAVPALPLTYMTNEPREDMLEDYPKIAALQADMMSGTK